MDIAIPVERTLTQTDYVRLTRLLQLQPEHAGARAMRELLECSDLVPAGAVDPGTVTMGTQVLLDDGRHGLSRLTICYPEDAQPAAGRVSVLSPVGTSLLGLRVGETARWRTPTGHEGAARIAAVLFQPETSEDPAP